MAMGASTGGIGSFTIAWEHPEFVRRVFSAIGTFVAMRGGDKYPGLIRKTEPKPIRVFLQDGAADTWNPAYGDWFQQNQAMEEALRFAGYDVNHSWEVLGHEGSNAGSVFPEAMKWLWRDYPQPITAGVSGNSWLKSVLVPGETWHGVDIGSIEPTALASAPDGSVCLADPAGVVYKLDDSAKAMKFAATAGHVSSMAFGPDGSLYVAQRELQRVVQVGANGQKSVAVSGIRADHVIVDRSGKLYITEPGLHEELPSRVLLVQASKPSVIDTGVRHATGLVISPDRARLMIAEGHTHWVYDSILQADGTIQDREHYYELQVEQLTDDGDWADAGDMAMDVLGQLYVATRMGVQLGDTEGRVAGVMTLAVGKVTNLCFGGKMFDTVYVVSRGKLYMRKMAQPTVPNFATVPASMLAK